MSDERSKRAANNKSLRLIKNELEALCERGFISDDQYDNIISTLPAEASLHGASTAPAAAAPAPAAQAQSPNPLSSGFAALSVNDVRSPSNPPPSYSQTPPPPPARNEPQEVGHAVAMYRYSDPAPADLNIEPGDHISIKEFVNNDWWLGKNLRTGEEGIFPKSYVRQEQAPRSNNSAPPGGFYGNDNKGLTYGQPQQQQGYYPGQQQYAPQQYPPQQYQQPQYATPPPSNPYAGPVPPMGVAEQPVEEGKDSKGAEMGKKFGKKLGNAAIFGAGATIGGNIVNSIF